MSLRLHTPEGQPLFTISLLWIPATLVAAWAQTLRNAAQRDLTASIGVIGATQARFTYGLPFAIIFLAGVVAAVGTWPPMPTRQTLAWCLLGAVAQIAATALMLSVMRQRSFAVTTAYTKTEPVQAAIFAALVLGDPLTPLKALAVIVATAGVLLMSFKPNAGASKQGFSRDAVMPLVAGVASGGLFALAAVGFRGAILSLDEGGFVLRASTILVLGLALQTAIVLTYLATFDRPALAGSVRAWRPSLTAGFLGALASQFWFIGFALTAVANVRTLALVEVFIAQTLSRQRFAEVITLRDTIGMAMIVFGVGVILWLSL